MLLSIEFMVLYIFIATRSVGVKLHSTMTSLFFTPFQSEMRYKYHTGVSRTTCQVIVPPHMGKKVQFTKNQLGPCTYISTF